MFSNTLATPAFAQQDRRLTNEGLLASVAHTTTKHNFKFGTELTHFPIRENFQFAVTDATAFAATFPYRQRECYAGIAEASLYVARGSRGRGAGKLALAALLQHAEQAGFWKLVSRVFPQNQASRRLISSLGFREVGIYHKHGKLDGVWRDVVIVERLIPANQK